jgi:hypothetical protein
MLVPFTNDIAPHGSRKPAPFSEFTSTMLGVPAIRGVIVIAAYLIISRQIILKLAAATRVNRRILTIWCNVTPANPGRFRV